MYEFHHDEFRLRPSGFQGRVRDHAPVRVPVDFLLKRVRVCARVASYCIIPHCIQRETRGQRHHRQLHYSPTGKLAL